MHHTDKHLESASLNSPAAYPILAGISSHDLLVCSKVPIPEAPSDLKGTAVPPLLCPGE